MTNNDYPRLCGGTFFTLALQCLRPRMKAREHYKGDSDGLTDPEVLAGLIQVVNPDYSNPGKEVLKTPANNYKACRVSSGAYLPFDDGQMIRAFDTRVKTDYRSALAAMTSFVNTYLDLGESIGRTTALVKALVDLIQQDSTIGMSEEFYIGERGQKIKKAALGDLSDVCLPSFLLGVWHYVIVSRQDNSIGQTTYDRWCPSNDRAPRKYTADMGAGVLDGLRVYVSELEAQDEVDDDVIIEAEPEFQSRAEQSAGSAPQSGTPVVNNNPIFIQQNGDGNMVIPNYGTITINKK